MLIELYFNDSTVSKYTTCIGGGYLSFTKFGV